MKVKNLKIGDTIYFLDIKALKIKQGIYLGEIKKFFYGIITQVKINSEDDIIYTNNKDAITQKKIMKE